MQCPGKLMWSFLHLSAQVAGQYVAGGKLATPARQAENTATANELWDVTCKLTGIQSSL